MDDGLDPADVEYVWAQASTRNGQPDAGCNGLSNTVTPNIAEVAFQDFSARDTIDLDGDHRRLFQHGQLECRGGSLSSPRERQTTTTCDNKIGWPPSQDVKC